MRIKNNKIISLTTSVFLLLIAIVTTVQAFNLPGFSKFEVVKPINGLITIETVKVNDGKAHYFKLTDAGKELKFFVVKGSDGSFHTAFDACDVCFREKKGYIQQADYMICKNCNQKFAIARIGADASAGCNPSHLSAKIDGKFIRIQVLDLKAGARFF